MLGAVGAAVFPFGGWGKGRGMVTSLVVKGMGYVEIFLKRGTIRLKMLESSFQLLLFRDKYFVGCIFYVGTKNFLTVPLV